MSKKPSILFITTDEQHISTISAFGATSHRTPAIDQLASISNVYLNAYSASPVCLPSRCVWMTGQYPHKSGSVSNTLGASLSLQYPNLFNQLKEQGYTTSMHGKCHFIPVPYPATRKNMTLEYEHFKLYYMALGMDHLDLQDDKNNSLWFYDDYGKDLEMAGLMKPYRYRAHEDKSKKGPFSFPGPAEMHPDSWVGQKALDYLEKCNKDDSHFMWVSFSGPHYPIDTPEEYLDAVDMDRAIPRTSKEGEWEDKTKYHHNGYYGPGTTEGSGGAKDRAQKNYDEAYWRRWRQYYYANVVQIDSYIGKIIDKAQKLWGKNLMIVFSSDHGDMAGNHGLWGKNGSLYEDVVKVPLIVKYPGQNDKKEIVQRVSSLEVFPTILKTAGCNIPECDGKPLDEMVAEGGRDYILSACDGRLTIIKKNIKLDWNHYNKTGDMYYELYDLNKDPHEFTNQYNNHEYAEVKEELETILKQLEKEEYLLSTIFYTPDKTPYWVNIGEGSGLAWLKKSKASNN